VTVRSKEEILSTLDEDGCVDGMPFMPEMLRFCGRQYVVRAVAHKTCDTERIMGTSRRMAAAVHLADLRCDGSSHGGCEAECTLFWKDVWLKPTSGGEDICIRDGNSRNAFTETRLLALAQLQAEAAEPPLYSCQATRLYGASELLPWWDLRQYWYDVSTGNQSLGRVVRVTWLASLRWMIRRTPLGYRILNSFSEWMHCRLTGRPAPHLDGKIKAGDSTPTGRLYLKPGELVRIKSQAEIEATIDETGRNRGLSFDPEEMAPFCGSVFRVHKVVTQIIDESTGKMRSMKQPCIMLEGVVCNAEYARCRLNCPRAIPSYWREIWLERVQENGK
jgi:hypothetical protein